MSFTIDEYTEAERLLIIENKKISRKKNYIDTKIAEVLGSYNNVKLVKLKPRQFLPAIDFATKQAKNQTTQKKIILKN